MRLAVALDRRQIGAIRSVQCEYRPDQQAMRLIIDSRQMMDDCALELWSLDNKKGSFETEYGIRLLPVLQGVPARLS